MPKPMTKKELEQLDKLLTKLQGRLDSITTDDLVLIDARRIVNNKINEIEEIERLMNERPREFNA